MSQELLPRIDVPPAWLVEKVATCDVGSAAQALAPTHGAPITDPAVIEATFAADFEAEGAPGREGVR